MWYKAAADACGHLQASGGGLGLSVECGELGREGGMRSQQVTSLESSRTRTLSGFSRVLCVMHQRHFKAGDG